MKPKCSLQETETKSRVNEPEEIDLRDNGIPGTAADDSGMSGRVVNLRIAISHELLTGRRKLSTHVPFSFFFLSPTISQ